MIRSFRQSIRLVAVLALLTVVAAACGWAVLRRAGAQEGPNWHEGLPRQHKSKWLVHDLRRPKAPKVTPGKNCGDAPSDAVVLFDGTDFSKWEGTDGKPVNWKIEDGVAIQRTDSSQTIRTKEEFGDIQLHLEFATPREPKGVSQGRGNSGILVMGRYEMQILDTYDNETYADGMAGAVYGQHPPLVNPTRPSGEWQSYDIVFRRPRFKDGEVVEPGRFTAFLNGVLVQHNAEIFGSVAWRRLAKYELHDDAEPLVIQDHGDKQPMRFRNIWARRIDLSPTE